MLLADAVLLPDLLKRVPAGQWAAIGRSPVRIVATDLDAAKVMVKSSKAGEPDPMVVRVPLAENASAPPSAISATKIPYDMIAYAIAADRSVVPFLGAGASLVGREQSVAFDERIARFLPNADELKELLAQRADFPPEELPKSDLAKVSSYFQWVGGRSRLRTSLRRALGPIEGEEIPRCAPSSLHRFLAKEEAIRLIITTNYDTLIEKAFEEAHREYDLLVYPAESPKHKNAVQYTKSGDKSPKYNEASSLYLDFSRTIIFKVHGSLAQTADRDGFVITEEDYIEFLSRMMGKSAIPPTVMDHISRKNLLFLGYSLRDWNLRLLIHQLQMEKSWAIQRGVTPVERDLWSSRQVKICDEQLDVFVQKIDQELRDYRQQHI